MILASVPSAWFAVIEGEDEDNLVELNILKRKMSSETDRIGVGQRLLQGAVNALDDGCKHNWGMAHFWGNQ